MWLGAYAGEVEGAYECYVTPHDWLPHEAMIEMISRVAGPRVWEAALDVDEMLNLGCDREKGRTASGEALS